MQSSLIWENISENLDQLGKKIEDHQHRSDLIVLPEMFTTGFSMNAHLLADDMNSETMERMKQWALKKDAMIIGSMMVKVYNQFYNRIVCMQPDGSFETYDKRHLFSLANENDVYSPGFERLIVDWRGWKICPLICYDLRFPCWSKNRIDSLGNPEYDLLIYVANWPDKRSYAWKQLCIARAIENQSYLIGVNRVGTDGNGYDYSGDSCMVDSMGKVHFTKENEEIVQTVSMNKKDLSSVRERLQFLKDSDELEVR